MTTNKVQPIVWTLAGLGLVVIGLIPWAHYQIDGADVAPTDVVYLVGMIAFVVSGAIIVSKQPGNVIGWLLMIPGLALPASELIHFWLVSLNPPPVQPDLRIWLAIWFDSWAWILLIYPIFHLLLTFPNGRLLSPRWRWVAGVEVTMALFMVAVVTFSERLGVFSDDETELWSIANPIGFISDAFFEGTFVLVWSLGLVGLTVVGVLAFVQRFRVGSAIERQQLKWPLFGIALFGFVYAWSALTDVLVEGSLVDALFGLALAAIPISVAIAVLRYRLYDLDRIVSRTVTYVAVGVLLVGAYALVVLGLGSFMGRRSNPVAVAAATLAAAALFNPVRNRIRRWVDRRFNRTRYDAERVIDTFTATLRDRVDANEVVDGWVGVVSETMQPEKVTAWIRP